MAFDRTNLCAVQCSFAYTYLWFINKKNIRNVKSSKKIWMKIVFQTFTPNRLKYFTWFFSAKLILKKSIKYICK